MDDVTEVKKRNAEVLAFFFFFFFFPKIVLHPSQTIGQKKNAQLDQKKSVQNRARQQERELKKQHNQQLKEFRRYPHLLCCYGFVKELYFEGSRTGS